MIKDLKVDSDLIDTAENDFNACNQKEEYLSILEKSIPQRVKRYNSEGTIWGLYFHFSCYSLSFNGARMHCTNYVDGIYTFLNFLTQLAYYDDKSLMCSYDDEGVENIMIAQPQGDNYVRISIFESWREIKLFGDFIIKKDTFLLQLKETFEEINEDWKRVKETEPKEFSEKNAKSIQKFVDYMNMYFTNKETFRKNYNPVKHLRVFDIAYKNLDGIWDFWVCLDDDEKADIEYWENQKQEGKILDFDYTEQTPIDGFYYDIKDFEFQGYTPIKGIPRKLIQQHLKPNMENRVNEHNWVYSPKTRKWYATNEIMDKPESETMYLYGSEHNFDYEMEHSTCFTAEKYIEMYLSDTNEEKDEYGKLNCIMYVKASNYIHKTNLLIEFDYGYHKQIREAFKKIKNNEDVRFNLNDYAIMNVWLKDSEYAYQPVLKNEDVIVAVCSRQYSEQEKNSRFVGFIMKKESFLRVMSSMLDGIEEKIQKVKYQLEIGEKLKIEDSFNFEYIEPFINGYSVVYKDSLKGYGIVNKNLEWVNEAESKTIYGETHPKYGRAIKGFITKYTFLTSVNGELFIAKKGGNEEKFIMDVNGDIKIPRVSKEIYHGYLNDELYFIFVNDDKTCITNSKGEDILELNYAIDKDFWLFEDKIIYSRNEHFGMIDWNGNLLFDYVLDEVKINPKNDDYIPVKYLDKWGLIDKKGNIIANSKKK